MPQMRIVPKFLIVFIGALLTTTSVSHAAWFGEITESNTAKAIAERLKPIGNVTIDGAPAVTQTASIAPADVGKNRYEVSCKVCHAAGVAGAPKFKSAEWKSRMGVGISGLLAVAIKGKGGMPPKGTCMSCTDEELKAAIEYMLPK